MCGYGHTGRSLTFVLQKDNALQLWGHPTSFPDIADLFAKFCAGQLVALPWSDSAPSQETGIISNQLAKMNRLGFLTINSQPAVNGVRSDDKIFGWGPSNGYVYQKVWTSSALSLTITYTTHKGIPGVLCPPRPLAAPSEAHRA
jgi:methylenetetrahydrofolate reductase (NADPH)